MNSRRERQKEVRRARIREVALDLFTRDGFDSTTVDAIAEAADISKGTFFNYYSAKQVVLVEYYLVLASDFLLLASGRNRGTALGMLQRFFQSVEERLRREGELLEVLFREVFARPDLIALDSETEEAILEIYRSRLRAGVASGELRADIDIGLAATMIVDIWSSTLRAWLSARRSFSLAATISRKLTMLFRGLQQRKD